MRLAGSVSRSQHILAYDVRCAKRLRKLYRRMLGWGVAVQYSVFAVSLDAEALDEMMSDISGIVDPEQDDVRLYRVPDRGGWWYWQDAVSDAMVLVGEGAPGSLCRVKRTGTES